MTLVQTEPKSIKIWSTDLKKICMWVWGTEKQIRPTWRLPSEYQEVEYIQSSWTQYISTNIIPSNTKGIYLKVSSQDMNNDLLYIGSRKKTDTRFWIWNYSGKQNNIYLWWNTNTDYANTTTNTIYEIKLNYLNDRKKQVDDNVIMSNIWTLSSNNNVPIYIFAWNENYTVSTPSKIKLYSCQITDWSNIVNDLVPCYRKADSVIWLYDLVNDTFYTNSWTWTFTKWSDVN